MCLFFGCVACVILLPQPGIEPMPLALEVQSLNSGTTRHHVFLKARPGSGLCRLWWECSHSAPAQCEAV